MPANDPSITPGVYRIYSRSGGDNYIGSAVCFRKRWGVHRRDLKAGKHHSAKLQFAWDERGEDDFEFLVLKFVPDKTLLIEREQYWIDHFDAVRLGFNMAPTAGSRFGLVHTPEALAKMSAAKTGSNHPNYGKKATPETRAKLSAAKTGSNNPSYGKKATPETRAKISAGLTGKKATPEARAKMSAAARNRTPEARAKMSAAQQRRHSREACAFAA